MIFRFNKAQLGAKMEKALNTFLDAIPEDEIEISADEFPHKLSIKRISDGSVVKILYDPEVKLYVFAESQPDPNEKVGDIKEWQRPKSAQAPEPAPEIKVTVDNVVSQFMGLPVDQRPVFFEEVWKLINAEVKG